MEMEAIANRIQLYKRKRRPYSNTNGNAEVTEEAKATDLLENKNQRMFKVTMLVYTFANDLNTTRQCLSNHGYSEEK